METTYIAIDLKSFYASVECMERGLDPLTTNLVVADVSRTEKTICLAVSTSLKAYGIPGRARLFEVIQRLKEVNAARISHAPGKTFTGESHDSIELAAHPELAISYLAAKPRMAKYIEISSRIYHTYLNFVSAEDIHVYSIDEVFIDAGKYLKLYGLSAHELAKRMIQAVEVETGITATAGIGSNLYLCKIAMDIGAKHTKPDQDGVRIAQLDVSGYRRQFWTHQPLTDFWRVGRGTAKRLASIGVFTMGDIARTSLVNEDVLYKLFGVNAELLIDHAWGYEPCTMKAIKNYQPDENSKTYGQVLSEPYSKEKGRIIVMEMADHMALDLLEKGYLCDVVSLYIGYDQESLTKDALPSAKPRQDMAGGQGAYQGKTETNWYGQEVPAHAGGTKRLDKPTSSARLLKEAVLEIYDTQAHPDLTIRRFYLTAGHVVSEKEVSSQSQQLDLFSMEEEEKTDHKALDKERKAREAMLKIKQKYGKNALVLGLNMEEGATGRERNQQIGGHHE
ncbi:MAG: DNA methylase [Firmicutes bacterium]|nr:DNA methylase [Bacillota bacterium]